MKYKFLVALVGALMCGTSSAAIFDIVADASLTGLSPGEDGFWGTADDAPSAPFGVSNPAGSSTMFSINGPGFAGSFDSGGNTGFSVGGFDTNGGGPNIFGVNTITSAGATGIFSNPFVAPFPFDEAFTQSLDLGVAATLTMLADHSVTGASVFDAVTASFGAAKFTATGSGIWLTPADDPVAIFGAGTPELDNFLALEPLLDPGWTVFAFVMQDYIYTAGLATGVFGTQFANFVSTDPGAAPIPIPAALPLAVSGLVGLFGFARRRRSHLV